MKLAQYQNGDYIVIIERDGTKIRYGGGIPDYPESIDIKITDYCENNCEYCYTNSGKQGNHADLYKLLFVLDKLPVGVEIAIGGGNPLLHPEFHEFVWNLRNMKLIANVTIHNKDIENNIKYLSNIIKLNWIKGIGVSVGTDFVNLKKLKCLSDNVVYHLIAGVHDVDMIQSLIDLGEPCKVLVLGYKKQGRGLSFYNELIDKNIKRWAMYLPKYFSKCTLSFDNLALEQLDAKRWFTDKEWEQFYMGDDGQFSMYIDAVKETFAKSSTSTETTPWNVGLLNFFKNNL